MDPDSVSPSAVPAGHAFRYRAKLTPERLGPYPTPVQYLDGGWTFTNSAGVVRPLGCGFETQDGGACIRAFYESGSIQLDAMVNGVHVTKGPIVITVIQPKLQLSLSKTDAIAGDTIVATMSMSPAGEREDWRGFDVSTQPADPGDGGIITSRAPTNALAVRSISQGALPSSAVPPAGAVAALRQSIGMSPFRKSATSPISRSTSFGDIPECGSVSFDFPKQCYFVVSDPGTATVTLRASYNRLPLEAKKTVTVKAAALTLSYSCDETKVRGETVTCTAAVTPAQPFTVVNRTATTAGGTFINDQLSTQVTANDTYVWEGTAAVSTITSLTVRAGAVTLPPKEASFTVTTRIGGPNTEWKAEELPSTVPDTRFASGPPDITAAYPSFIIDPSVTTGRNYGWIQGALGQTFPPAAEYTYQEISSGPNKGITYATAWTYKGEFKLFVARSLDSGDDFYKRQKGGFPGNGGFPRTTRYCNGSDVGSLFSQVQAHERGHITTLVARLAISRPRKNMEGTVHVPGVTPITADSLFKAAAFLYTSEQDAANTTTDATIRIDPPNCVMRP